MDNSLKKMDVPGFEGLYYVRNDGTLWRYGDGKIAEHRLYGCRTERSRKFTLHDSLGNMSVMTMSKIMRNTFFKGKMPDNYVFMHINGLEADYSVRNLKPMSRKELGKLRYRSYDARTVIKRDTKTWKVVGFYRSAKEAAMVADCSYHSILDACNRKTKVRPGIAADGYYYQWED